MNILVISSGVSDDDFGINGLVAALQARGHSDQPCININDCVVENGQLFIAGNACEDIPDIVIGRPEYPNDIHLWDAVLGFYEGQGALCVNSREGIRHVNDKLTMHGRLLEAGLPLPLTAPLHSWEALADFTQAVPWPLVLKQSRGVAGRGVRLCADNASLVRDVAGFLAADLGNKLLVQQFIPTTFGRDVRAFVIGDQVVAAMLRQGREGEFRSNIGAGGYGSPYSLSPEWQAVAVSAARAVDLEIAGVDLLFGENDQPVVCEINRTPGFKGLMGVYPHLDIPTRILDHALQLHRARDEEISRTRRLNIAVRTSAVAVLAK